MIRRPSVRRAVALSTIGLLALGGLAACGDDAKSDDTSDRIAPEDVKVPMDQVLNGLPEIVEHGNRAAAAGNSGDFATASREYDELHEGWEAIEGTIKDSDLDTYEAMETAQGLIKDGADHKNAERVQQGADDQSEAAQAFIAAHSQQSPTTVADGGSGSTTTTLGGAGDSYATDEGATSTSANG
jgi:hypothetical protein